jgi:T-complex protein 1 subunit alpha
LAVEVNNLNKEHLINVAKTTKRTKIIGTESSLFAELAVDAITSVKTDAGKYPVKAVNILKTHG